MYPVVDIATVELNTDLTVQPTYYFDCTTNLTDGSGLTWSRVSGTQRFPTSVTKSSTLRLDATGISQSDLGVYICSDTLSSDTVTLNITDCELAMSIHFQYFYNLNDVC